MKHVPRGDEERSAHPDAPASRSGLGSTRGPGPVGVTAIPDARVHPDAPGGRFQIRDGSSVSGTSSIGRPGFEKVTQNLEGLLAEHATRLRDAIRDPVLQAAYELHLDAAAAAYRRERASGSSVRESLFRRLHVSTSWVDKGLVGFMPAYGSEAGGGARRGLAAESLSPDEFFRRFKTVADQVYESALAHLERRWAEASAAGPRALDNLLVEWKRRLEYYQYTRPAGNGQEGARQTAPAVTPGSLVNPTKTWVEIRLIDEEGNPVPHVAYDVTLPDGGRHTGRLGADATLTFTNIDPGQCKVTFPDLDGREWRPA
jgi:hypothetical protein